MKTMGRWGSLRCRPLLEKNHLQPIAKVYRDRFQLPIAPLGMNWECGYITTHCSVRLPALFDIFFGRKHIITLRSQSTAPKGVMMA